MKKVMKWTTVLVMVLLLRVHIVTAQEHYNAWFRFRTSVQVGSKTAVDAEIQHRRQNGYTDRNMVASSLMSSYRLWVHRTVGQNIKLSVAPVALFYNYAVIQGVADKDIAPIKEMRVTAAAEMRGRLAPKLYWISRPSVDYRMFSTVFPNIVRARERLSVQYSVGKHVDITVFDELLLNVDGLSMAHLFDQNRIAVDAEYRAMDRVKLNISYMRILRLPLAGSNMLRENNLILSVTYMMKK